MRVMSSENRCSICGNQRDNHVFSVREMMFGYRDLFEYLECKKCGCLQLKQIPDNLSKYYPPEYYSLFQHLQTPNRLNRLKEFVEAKRNYYAVFRHSFIGRVIYFLKPNLFLSSLSNINLNLDSPILDVGCGSGSLLYILKKIGFRQLQGIDKYCENSEKPVKIKRATIDEVKGTWELILFNHSFEHILNQQRTLNAVSKLLSDTGICLINIPTVSSYAWKHYGVNWVQIDAPRHLFIHSIESLRLIAEASGLYIKEVIYNSTEFQFWGSEQYCQDIPLFSDKSFSQNASMSIFSKSQIKKFRFKAEELNKLNQGDQVAVFLRKINSN